jgi:hypothetical protein
LEAFVFIFAREELLELGVVLSCPKGVSGGPFTAAAAAAAYPLT